ncbi:MAG: RidA family protein [Rhodospirillales bacterium]|jgi:2-iminobutanoate/2-iminopropanoate deaminase|nr:RidA family protein [Rhodospirillales bacterium]
MAKKIEHIHWLDAPDLWMPYTPVIKATGGSTVYFAGVTAAPVYHHHPHRPGEFDNMPGDMEGQARAAVENLNKGLQAVNATVFDIVTASFYLTDFSDQPGFYTVWNEYLGDATPATTMVKVQQLATDPRCLIEINAIAVVD